jgi:putative PIN family toxin of toxin-antitoxin system
MPRASVVLDTNVVVSAHLNPDGYERFVLDLGIAGTIQIYVSAEILEEYSGVLSREKFGISPHLVDAALHAIMKSAKIAKPSQRVRAAKDPDDNKFLECALEAGADYLVTGNKRHFSKRFGRTRVVSARELVEEVIPDLRR